MELDELNERVSQSRHLEGTGELVGDMTTQARESTAQQRRATAPRIGSLASAGHHAAGDLEEHFPQVARYIHDAAAGFEHISSFRAIPILIARSQS